MKIPICDEVDAVIHDLASPALSRVKWFVERACKPDELMIDNAINAAEALDRITTPDRMIHLNGAIPGDCGIDTDHFTIIASGMGAALGFGAPIDDLDDLVAVAGEHRLGLCNQIRERGQADVAERLATKRDFWVYAVIEAGIQCVLGDDRSIELLSGSSQILLGAVISLPQLAQTVRKISARGSPCIVMAILGTPPQSVIFPLAVAPVQGSGPSLMNMEVAGHG